jgi:hypothetical protein
MSVIVAQAGLELLAKLAINSVCSATGDTSARNTAQPRYAMVTPSESR